MTTQKPILPRLNTGISFDEPTPERLLQAVAQTLDTPRDNILLFDSFTDLGRDEETAEMLRETCRERDVNIKPQDALQCQTLVELQTRITPFPPKKSADFSDPSSEEESSSRPTSVEDAYSSEPHLIRADSMSSYEVPSSPSKSSTADRTGQTGHDLESLLKSSPRVRNVCLVTPKAGPFDGQLVALIEVTTGETTTSTTASLPPRSEHGSQRQMIRSLRTNVQGWCADSRRPQIWIPLQTMAVESHLDTRKLQTWVQNINEAAYHDIMELQIPEPRRRAVSPTARRKRIETWAESRESVWKDEALDLDCDEMECFPLSPMQSLYLRVSNSSVGGQDYTHTQSVLLRVKDQVEISDIEAAVEAMVSRHSMLRARFRPFINDWVQVTMPQSPSTYRFKSHDCTDDEGILAIVQQARAAINPVDGPVFASEHVQSGTEQMICLVAHHLVVDSVSWRIIVHDLDELLQSGTLLSEGSLPFPHWIDYQSYEASQRLFEPALPFDVVPADIGYWGLENGPNSHGDALDVSFSLSAELSHSLKTACSEALRTEPADVYLACLLSSFCQIFPDRTPPTLWKQEHGRDTVHADFNIMETVGWFASLCPVGVSIDSSTDVVQAVKLIKDARRAISRDGASQDLDIPVEVAFSYAEPCRQLQREDGILEPIALPNGESPSLTSEIGPQVGRMALFDVSVTSESETHVNFSYNKNTAHRSRIEVWAEIFERQVLQVIERLAHQGPELTLSDVPLVRTSYKALERLSTGLSVPEVDNIETIYPITPAQQEVLIAQTQNPHDFYVSAVYELSGEFKTSLLCQAWEDIVANKPSLRSVFIDAVSCQGLFDQAVLKQMSPYMISIESPDSQETLSHIPPMKTGPLEPRHRLVVCRSNDKTLIRLDASQAICDVRPRTLLDDFHN